MPLDDSAIRATGLLVPRGRRGGDAVDLDVPSGTLLVITGGAASGKTALALTLAGRMPLRGGSLEVLGDSLPRNARSIRGRTGLVGDDRVSPLDGDLTVHHHIAEAVVLAGPWWRPWASVRATQQVIDRVDSASRRIASESRTPARPQLALDPRALVADLQPLARLTLSLALALVPRPQLLVVDDVDRLRDTDDRRMAWSVLLGTEAGLRPDLTIVATAQDPRELDDARRAAAASARPVVVLDLDAVSAEVAPAIPAPLHPDAAVAAESL